MKKIIALFVACLLTPLCVADEYGPFGTDYVIEQTRPTSLEDIDLTIHGEPMALGDCVALYRVSDSAYCGVGKVVEYKGALQLTITAYLVGGTKVHFKVWQRDTDTVYDCDESCNYTIPTTGDGFVSGLVLTVTPEKVFGPGRYSRFTVKDVGKGTLVGVSGIIWSDFANTDYYGVKTFVNESIVDAEKTAADDADDYWCYQMSDMNTLYLTGWATNTSYATVDDMVGYFRKNPRLLRYMQAGELNEGTYGFVNNWDWGDFFDWYKDVAGVDLLKTKVLTEGVVGPSFLPELKELFDNGRNVIRVNVYFDNVTQNKKWTGMAVAHGVLCVGYVADGDTLKALFIIDPDNNQYTGAGGVAAPNSVMYCPVTWNATSQSFMISGVWGQEGELLPEYRALSVMPMVYTVTFDKNGGTGTMASQKFPEGVEQALTKNAFKKSGYMFVGWKDQHGNSYEDEEAITPTSDLTLTAQWEKIVVACDPNSATYAWRGTGDDLLVGEFGVTCNTDWIVATDKDWLVLFLENGSGNGQVHYGLTENDSAQSRKGTITVTSKIDGTVKATFTVNQRARPSEPDLDIQNGVLVGVDMNGYDKLDVPSGVTAIGANAFACNDEVCSVRIPATVTEIGDSAFAGCANLTNVVFDGNAPTTGNDIFKDTPDGLVVTVRNDKTDWPNEGELWPEGDADARTVAVIKNYIVSFDWNGWEDGPAIEDMGVEPGERIAELPGNEIWIQDIPVRAGYSFRGWTDGVVTNAPYKGYTPVGSVVLKAVWYAKYYTFKFDANGGKPAIQENFQRFGEPWGNVKDPTLAKAVFDGWWTAKTGGEKVDLSAVCSIVGDEKKATTIYAHWRKMFKGTVKDGMVSEDAENFSANVTVLSGTKLYLKAADKSDKNMEFAKWTYSPATANLGENFNPRDPETSFTMPAASVTFTANYIAKPGYVEVIVHEVNATLNEEDDPQGIEWSDDGKVWTPVGDGNAYPIKTGKSVAIQFRSTDPRWTVPAKVNYPIVEDETTAIGVAATRVSVVAIQSAIEQFGASGSVSMNPKNGQVLPGKPVTLTAKPGKDTVFAYWTVGGEKVGYTATFKYAPDADCTATAVFRLKSAVEDPVLDADAVVPSANAMVGVAFESQVPLADAVYPAKFSAKGLPAGLKIDAASGIISGVPTKAGSFPVTVTAAGGVNTKAKPSVTIPIAIKPLPTWAQGTFTGYVQSGYEEDEDMEPYYEGYGSVSMSVSAAGKITGKMSLNGTSYSFGATSFDMTSVTDAEDEGAMSFAVVADAKAGKAVFPLSFNVAKAAPPAGDGETLLNSVATGEFENGGDMASVRLFRTIWKDKATVAVAKLAIAEYEGVYTMSLEDDEDRPYGSGYLSLTVGKDGNVKAAGKLADGTSVSMTSPLMYDVDAGYFVYLYSAPSAYKGGALALTVTFEFDEDQKLLGNALGIAQWSSHNPQATGDYGEGFDRWFEFTGAYYNKLETLYAYYDSLRFEPGNPVLQYTYKHTMIDEESGKKVTESSLDETDAVGADGELTVTVNEKGALVVPKATKPVYDKEYEEWRYEGANDGALTLSFTQATGIFKGSYTFWFDYESAYDETKDKLTIAHTSKKVNFEGIMVQGAGEMRGFYLWDMTGIYEDLNTEKEKTYKYKQSYPVRLTTP